MTAVHPAYRRGLAHAVVRLQRSGRIDAAIAGTRCIAVRADNVSLALLVEEAEPGCVRDARHDGATDIEAALLDRFCALMIGRPLYEIVHHGVIRLEADLRDPAIPPPVPGIVLPQNADPIFALPLRLVRALRDVVGPLHLAPSQRGQWEDRPAPAWLSLTRAEQIERLHAALADAIRALAIDVPPPVVVDVKDGFRVVIAPPAADHRLALGPALMKIERAVQSTLDSRLELLFETAADRNHRAERLIKIPGS